ncbi:hypothetical protein [Sphingomonas sp. KC8]|uniref:hypothetical protein n=1 Tax=Sphingomonas sp. KC8 TaxID=1030157 RepID=UPI000248BEBE|nr:hypothetical protein [Sphingomonas sp. KC8]ARS26342.1 hypothetical protein KC8_03425 [Sphingomonas sp. KC8]
MASYRLFLWSRGENRLQEHQVATDTGAGSIGLLETLNEIGRHAMRDDDDEIGRYLASCAIVAEPVAPRRPAKLVRARRHLSAARQLLEDVGEHMLAARTAVPLAELNRRS